VLEHLAEHAWKSTARRDDITIEFATTTDDEATVCCYVRDNGIGFDPPIPTSCSSGSPPPANFPAPAPAWSPSSASSNATAGAPGPRAPSTAAPPSAAPSARKIRRHGQVLPVYRE
jgi:hypothetical protein